MAWTSETWRSIGSLFNWDRWRSGIGNSGRVWGSGCVSEREDNSMSLDTRSEKCILSLHPKVQANFRAFLEQAQTLAFVRGFEYKAICGTRTWEEQESLYAQGRTKPGKIVTKAPPGSSFHNFGLAIDCGLFKDGIYLDDARPDVADKFHREAAPIAKKNGLRWGGDFKSITDMPHFEYDTKRTLSEMRDLHEQGKDALA